MMKENELFQKAIAEEMPNYEKTRYLCLNSLQKGKKTIAYKRMAVAFSIIGIFLIGGSTVYAVNNWFGVGRVTDENSDKLNKPGTTNATESMQNEKKSYDWETVVLDDAVPIVMNLEGNGYVENDLFITPGYTAMFYTEESRGFLLEKGDILTCNLDLDLLKMESGIDSIGVEFGYIKEGEYFTVDEVKGSSFEFQLVAGETGEYYPCLVNRSSANAVLEEIQITEK